MPVREGLTHRTTTKSIASILKLYRKNQLELSPAFQRQSVWTERDRSKLIESILLNYPLPAVFLYRRKQNGRLIFDVVDGKQRLESILRFVGAIRDRFEVRIQDADGRTVEHVDWQLLKKRNQRKPFEGYRLPIIEVSGAISDIYNVFIRINSTGKVLTGQEKRHAKFHNSEFLKLATKIATSFEDYFRDEGVLSAGQIKRMKHIELVAELMLSLERRGVLNKKSALDAAMKGVDGRQLPKLKRGVTSALKRTRAIMPKLKTTRFSKLSDFYSLAYLIGQYEADGLVLSDKRINQLAEDLLVAFSIGVDEVAELQRKARGVAAHQEQYRRYLLTVREGTDSLANRSTRHDILDGLFGSLFASKDQKRGFSKEQRRVIWNTAASRTCAHRGCKTELTWEDFTIDHIKPHSKGGRTELKNAALMCRKHNSAKGNRSRRRRSRRT